MPKPETPLSPRGFTVTEALPAGNSGRIMMAFVLQSSEWVQNWPSGTEGRAIDSNGDTGQRALVVVDESGRRIGQGEALPRTGCMCTEAVVRGSGDCCLVRRCMGLVRAI